MKISFLASSSKANCTLLEADGEAIVVDAGLPVRTFLRRLRELSVPVDSVKAILVSHHHADHAGKAGELSAALHIPIFCSSETLEAAAAKFVAKAEAVEVFTPGDEFHLGKFKVLPVDTYHTPGAVGFRIASGGRYASIFTDVPELTGPVADALTWSHLIFVESDFSESMLDACGYVDELKRRIRLSHCSNEKLAAFFRNGFTSAALRTIVLGHLSLTANLPFLAESSARAALGRPEVKVYVAEPEGTLGPLEV